MKEQTPSNANLIRFFALLYQIDKRSKQEMKKEKHH